jgi:SRSO17 transposase
VAVEASIDVDMWREQFDTGGAWIACRFGRAQPRLRGRAFLLGLLSDVDCRSCWQLAEQAGDRSPHAMQRLLGDAVWDADSVRDDLRGYVADELGGPDGVLTLDDTGDLKKGVHSVCVQRKYTGWVWLRITPPADEVVGHHWLLARRNITDGVLAYCRCWSPGPTTLVNLVRVAGTRWCVEECFQAGQKARSAWTSTRFGGGDPGTATPSSSCSPTPSSRSSPHTSATVSRATHPT